MDPTLACTVIEQKAKAGKTPKALVLVHLYGQSADIAPIKACCDKHGVKLIEDAAEALGATYGEASPGSFGLAGIHSFNGNKIITTGGGGMLVTDDAEFAKQARFLATQARYALRIISIPPSGITTASATSPPASGSARPVSPAKSPSPRSLQSLR
jgi:pyridoxal phosphate-dependent aminotransferase EpsN